MSIKEFAQQLNGKEYGYPMFTEKEIQTAKDNGWVIVTGASDDLMEFEGAIRDEGVCFDGGKVFFSKSDIPHETFMVYEDEEPYCRGIVFSVNDLK